MDLVEAKIDSQIRSLCSPKLLNWHKPNENQTCHAYLHADKIVIANPRVSVRGQDSSSFNLKLGIVFDSVSAPFTVFTSDGDGKNENEFNSTISLENFELYTVLTLTPPEEEGAIIDVRRSPAKLYMIPEFFWNNQAYLRHSKCVGACAPVGDLLEAAYNLRLTEEGRSFADDMLKQVVAVAESGLGYLFDTSRHPIQINEQTAFIFTPPQKVTKVSNNRAHWLDKSPRNAHLGFTTYTESEGASYVDKKDSDNNRVEDENGNGIEIVDSPTLGLAFSNKNNYGYVKNANFQSKEPGVNGSRIDFAYAISQDSVNQILRQEYRTSSHNTQPVTVTSTSADELFFDNQKAVCMSVVASKAPRVEFQGYYSKKVNVDVTLTDKIKENAEKEKAARWKQLCEDEYGENAQECAGIEHDYESIVLLDTSEETVPGNVKLIMDDVKLTATKGECGVSTVADWELLDADITVRMFVTMEDGEPVAKAYDRKDGYFVSVLPKTLEQSLMAAEFKKLIEVHVKKELDAFNQSQPLSSKWVSKGLDELPGLDTFFDKTIAGVSTRELFSQISGDWKVRYGFKFLSFGIEPSGGYFRFTGKVDTKTYKGASCEDDGYFRYFCIKQQRTAD